MAAETKQEEIRRKSLERLQKEISAYTNELASFEEERKAIIAKEGEQGYSLNFLNERIRETKDALRSTENTYERIKGSI